MTFYLVGPFYPLRGGIAQYIGVLGQKLQQNGHRVKVLSLRKQFPRFLFPGQTQIESSREYIELNSEAVLIPWNPLTWWRTFRHVRRDRPDALVFKYWMPFFAPAYAAVCALTKWFTDGTTIFILDNVIPHEKRPGDKFLTRLACRWVDGFVAQSQAVRSDLLQWFPEAESRSVELVPHPVYDCYKDADVGQEEARRRLKLENEGVTLLFFGLVRRYKGLDILLQALPDVIRRLGEKVHLIIAGEFYDPVEDYRSIIAEKSLSGNVTLIDQYIPNEEVGLYFRAADLLVLPYRSATQSGVIQVANHYGLPVVSTRVGGLPEIIQDGVNGLLVPSEDPESLAEAIVRYFESDLGETIAGRLKAQDQEDGWRKMVGVLENFAELGK